MSGSEALEKVQPTIPWLVMGIGLLLVDLISDKKMQYFMFVDIIHMLRIS